MDRIPDNTRASPAQRIRHYKQLSMRLINITTSIWFNHLCIRRNITPKYVVHRTCDQYPYHSTKLTKHRKQIIKIEIRKLYAKYDRMDTRRKILYDELETSMSHEQLTHNLGNIYEQGQRLNIKRRMELRRKVNNWEHRLRQPIQENDDTYSTTNFHQRTINKTNITFNEKELDLLDKGLQHNLTPNNIKKGFERMIIDTEMAIQQINYDNKQLLKNHCAFIIKQLYNKTKDHKGHQTSITKSIKRKTEEHNAIITRGDKGRCTIIMDKLDYIERVEKFLVDNNFEHKPKFNITTFNNKVKNTIKLYGSNIPDLNFKKLILNNPQTPKLYGLMKIHKTPNWDEVPIRPVVSSVDSSTYNLCKFLNKDIKMLLDLEMQYTVKNSLELTQKIVDTNVPEQSFLISLDVKNLFTNVPVQETLNIIKDLFIKNNIDEERRESYFKLLETAVGGNMCQFNNKIWIQKDGLAMGSPLSPLLADIFMDWFESNMIFTNDNLTRFTKNIIFYFRYVDDILVLWNAPKSELATFLDALNQLHSNIQFSLEVENSNKSLNFLDLTISRHNNKLKFGIYHKETTTGSVIHNTSNHPFSQKLAAFNSYIHRLLSLPLDQLEFKKEIKYIKSISYSNGYDPKLIDRLIHKKQLKISRNNAFQETKTNSENQKFVTLSYIGNPSLKMSKILKQSDPDVKVAFRTTNKIQSFLPKNKDKTDKLEKSGVYELTCANCQSSYVGKTFRNFKTRIKEHLYAVKKPDLTTSHFANHLKSHSHTFNLDTGFKILHVESKNNILVNLEALEIYKLQKDNSRTCLNQQNNFEISNLFKALS